MPPAKKAKPFKVPAAIRNLSYIRPKSEERLGGSRYRLTSMSPFSAFSEALLKTPWSNDQIRVIPWDAEECDFVYGAVHRELFGGVIGRAQVKVVILNID